MVRPIFTKLLVLSILAPAVTIIILPSVVWLCPFLIGAEESLIVTSGSMAPALNSGDLIFIESLDKTRISPGDVITVGKGEMIYTHRVIDIRMSGNQMEYRTKGDANEDPDSSWIQESQIMGKVYFTIPTAKFYTEVGFASLFFLPCAYLLIVHLSKFLSFSQKRGRKASMRWAKQDHALLDTGGVLALILVCSSGAWIMAPVLGTGSFGYFHDAEQAEGVLRAGIWEVGATVQIETDIDPDTLNLDSHSKWVTAYIETEYDEEDIVKESLMLEEIQASWSEVQDDGCFMVKFDKEALSQYLIEEGYWSGDSVSLTVCGEFEDGVGFEGQDSITIVFSE